MLKSENISDQKDMAKSILNCKGHLSVNTGVKTIVSVSQMSYSLVVMLELNGVSEIQYKEIMIIGNE